MKEYDLIVVGTGSAMEIVSAVIEENPQVKVAVIDKDEPGGICLTRGCIPSKILTYPSEVIRTIERAGVFGIDVEVKKIDFAKVMRRMRNIIDSEINSIRDGLSHTKNIDYYPAVAGFIAPFTMSVGNQTIKSKMIILGVGSKTTIPLIKGLPTVGYLTSDTVLKLTRGPESIAIIGGGYIAAEYGHFFSAMGSKVTIVGRNPQFLPDEEPEVSALAKSELQKQMTVFTNHEVQEANKTPDGMKRLIAVDRTSGKTVEVVAEEILVATGRGPNTDILHPEKSGIKTNKEGWIVVNEYLETSQPGIWALGDAIGNFPFKHKANYDAQIVYYNAILKKMAKTDYHAVPHAVFTYPEVASVGIGEKEAIEKYGKDSVLIGSHQYQDTAKGEAMGIKENYFVKVIAQKGTMKILGAHIIGPYASALIQEIVNLMNTTEQSAEPILKAMHIHPALSEVVQKAVDALGPPDLYHHVLEHHIGIPL